MENEKLREVKEEMKAYRDTFGGQLNRSDLIDDAKSIIDLESIINYHYDYITDMASDAQSSLLKFKQKLGLS